MRVPHHKDPMQVEIDRRIKIHRAAIRLKYSLMADEEIADTLPAVIEEFQRELEAGEVRQLTVGSPLAS